MADSIKIELFTAGRVLWICVCVCVGAADNRHINGRALWTQQGLRAEVKPSARHADSSASYGLSPASI